MEREKLSQHKGKEIDLGDSTVKSTKKGIAVGKRCLRGRTDRLRVEKKVGRFRWQTIDPQGSEAVKVTRLNCPGKKTKDVPVQKNRYD